jgi:hypothetical protein
LGCALRTLLGLRRGIGTVAGRWRRSPPAFVTTIAARSLAIARALRSAGLRRGRAFGPRIGTVIQHAIIVFGVLKEGLGHDPVAGGDRLAGQREVFLIDLSGISPDLAFGAIALEGHVPMMVAVRLIPVGTPPHATPTIGVLSHTCFAMICESAIWLIPLPSIWQPRPAPSFSRLHDPTMVRWIRLGVPPGNTAPS